MAVFDGKRSGLFEESDEYEITMFKITPIQDFNRQEEVAKACLTYGKCGAFAYEMIDQESGSLLGMSQFEIENGKAILFDLHSAPDVIDFEAMFILGRQTLNFIDLCGVHECVAMPNAADERLLKCVGFQKIADGKWICKTEGMFDGHCNGTSKQL